MSAAVERMRAWLTRPLRDPNPILLKELRATFRTALFIRFLYLTAGLVGLLVLTWGAVTAGERAPAEVGQEVFHVFFSIVIVVLSMVAPAYAATTIAGEKRSGTFESLILSGMSPARIVWGKFVACYAAIVLCVIAAAPACGLAFLFGGISPFAVMTGFGYVLLALAPAVAFGLAISARLESLWLAIVIAFFTYSLASMFFVWPTVVALGAAAHDAWGTPFGGPFWFAEAFPERIDTWDGWAFLVVLPLYVFGMPVWFFLASAVAGVQPPAEDRSTPLKVWSVPAIGGAGILAASIVSVTGNVRDSAELGVGLSVASGWLMLFVSLLFADEPPLPPRQRASPSLLRRVLSPIGPGAAPSLRFAFLAVLASAAVVPVSVSLTRWVRDPAWSEHLAFDAALFAIAIGNAAVGLFVAAVASWLRLALRNGLAARVLTLALIAAAVLLPFLVTLVIDDDALGRLNREIPLPMMVSPLLPTILGIAIGLERDMLPLEAMRVVVPAIGYGLLAVAAWIAVEARCVIARRAMAERRRRLIARSEGEAPRA
ncbi:MAG: ABC transporter permease, partial [Myxococcota bacterium]|nr:ABC transporter permease [Myxococcota bacterium]